MDYFFMIFMAVLAFAGGGFLFRLSDRNYDVAAFAYGVAAVLWAGVCLVFAAFVRV